MADKDQPFSDFKFYHYNPSMVAAVIFLILFLGTTGYHGYQLAKGKVWYYIPIVVGGAFEILGYIGRAMSAKQSPDWTLTPYLLQGLFLLLAPALFAASIYMELGRIILLVDGERYSPIPKRWLTKIFVTGDVLSFMVQSAGGGLLAVAKTAPAVKRGEGCIIAGLFIQIFFFAIFMIVSSVFHLRIGRNPTTTSLSPHIPWLKHQYALYGSSLLILIRSVFRAIEYIQGNTGYLLTHEVYLYIFDALLMFAVMVIFNIFHGGEIANLLRGKDRSHDSYEVA